MSNSDPVGLGPLVGYWGDGPERGFHIHPGDLRGHLLVLGRSGTGKTTLLGHLVAQKLALEEDSGRDLVVVIDPHGDLVDSVLRQVPLEVAERALLLDFGSGDRVPAVNLLDPRLFPDREECVRSLMDTFRYSWPTWGGRIESILRSALLSFYDCNGHPDTIPGDMLTLLDLPVFLSGEEMVGSGRDSRVVMSGFQNHVLARGQDPGLAQWFHGFLGWSPGIRAEALTPLISEISSCRSHQVAGVVMGQRESLLTGTGLLSDGRVVLVSTGGVSLGSIPQALLGSSLIGLVESHLRGQAARPVSERVGCLLVCEDYSMFPGTDWVRMLGDFRKLGGRLALSSRSLMSRGISEQDARGVLGGVGCVAGFDMSPVDAGLVSREMDLEDGFVRLLSGQRSHEFRFFSRSLRGVRLLPPADGSDESVRRVLASSRAVTLDAGEARERLVRDAVQRGMPGRSPPVLRCLSPPGTDCQAWMSSHSLRILELRSGWASRSPIG